MRFTRRARARCFMLQRAHSMREHGSTTSIMASESYGTTRQAKHIKVNGIEENGTAEESKDIRMDLSAAANGTTMSRTKPSAVNGLVQSLIEASAKEGARAPRRDRSMTTFKPRKTSKKRHLRPVVFSEKQLFNIIN